MYKVLLIGSFFLSSALGFCVEESVEQSDISIHNYQGELVYDSPSGRAHVSNVALLSPWFTLTTASKIIHYDTLVPSHFSCHFSHESGSVETFYIFPGYNHFTQENDLAVVELRHPISLDEFNQPIKFINMQPAIGTEGFLVGKFDDEYNKQIMHMELVDPSVCAEELGIEGDMCGRVKCDAEGRNFFCANSIGGPFVVDGKLAGLASQPACKCGKIDHPTAFTTVVDKLDFINEIISKNKTING